jgi:hypothetical protein
MLVVALAMTGTNASAETADKNNSEAPAAPVAGNAYIGNEPIEECMKRWDADTHMSKEDWRRTCERIRKEREPYAKSQ